MRRLISIIFLLMVFAVSSYAHFCIPDTSYHSPGIFPKVADGQAGLAYTQSVTVVQERDTLIGGTLYTIDSMTVDTLLGLPEGLIYGCHLASCAFLEDDRGCIFLFGTLGIHTQGDYPLKLCRTFTLRDGASVSFISDTLVFDTLNVSAPPPIVAGFTADGKCFGTGVHFDDTSTATARGWHWDFDDGIIVADQNPTHLFADTGLYTVRLIVTDSLNALSYDTMTQSIRIYPKPNVNAGMDVTFCLDTFSGYNLTPLITSLVPINKYKWIPNVFLSNDSIENPISNPTNTTNYKVTVTDTNGCFGSDQIRVFIVPCDYPTIINEIDSDLKIWQSNNLVFVVGLENEASYSILSIDGKVIEQGNLFNSTNQISIESFNKGAYLLEVMSNGQRAIAKFVK